jgi:agmatinase
LLGFHHEQKYFLALQGEAITPKSNFLLLLQTKLICTPFKNFSVTMVDLSTFDPNAAGNPNNNIFGLPFSEEDARLIILPVPWEVSVSYGSGTARTAERLQKASLQIDLYDPDNPEGWKQGFYMRDSDKKLLMKSDYLRKEAELYIDYISTGQNMEDNQFMRKSLKEINEGSLYLNKWVYDQTKSLFERGKLVALLGGDHSVPLGFFKAIGEKHGEFGILQIDAHCDLRIAYEGFNYSHASITHNALTEIESLIKVVQVGVRDYSGPELEYIRNSGKRIVTYFDRDIKKRQFEGETWKEIVDDIVSDLPHKVHISFDIDGLDPKLCPNTGTPVHGGLETEQVYYLFNKVLTSGRILTSFDLVEVGVGETDWDLNVGARILWKLCNLLAKSQ